MQDSDFQLLSAFVDGELTRSERKAVLRLLHGSSEARRALWQLRENAIALHGLPAKKAPADLAAKVMASIEKAAAASPVPPQPAQYPAARSANLARQLAVWLATAAVLLLAVGGAFLYLQEHSDDTIVAKGDNSAENEVNKGPAENKDAQKPAVEKPGRYFAFRDLKDKTTVHRLAKELAKPAGDRLQVTVADSGKALQKINQAFASKGIRLITDGSVQASLKSDKSSEFWVFAETSTPEEIAGMLGRMQGDDNFDGLQVLAMTGEDRKVLAGVMGIDQNELGNPREPLKLFDPITDGGSKEKKTPITAPSETGKADRFALAFAQAPHGKNLSPQVQNFLRQRRPLQRGTVQVVFVVRPM